MTSRVLIIEDNEQNRYLTTFMLERHGYEVFSAVDGPQGIEMAKALAPDIILLDIQLPDMDGYAVARALRGMESLRRTPIVAVTSYAMLGDREKSLAAGCNGYIEKPINPETFVAEMEKAAAPASREEGGAPCAALSWSRTGKRASTICALSSKVGAGRSTRRTTAPRRSRRRVRPPRISPSRTC